METRKSSRHAARTPVKLYSEVFGEFIGISRNISDSGVFIDIEPFLGLQTENEHKLVFINSVNNRVIFNVKFVRDTEQGIAFQFVDYETAGVRYQIDDLRNLWQIHKSSRSIAA
jgi:hypothetical protein